jgi:hypothetical protein
LWSIAIDVARREGVNRTAQQLHLDAGKLKRFLVAADGEQLERQRQSEFWSSSRRHQPPTLAA